MPSIPVTIDKLELSPFNARKDKRDMEATEAMEASLLAKGQIFPLLVHPLAGKKGRFGVFAGGRRLRSFRRLIARGALPADHPIEIIIHDKGP
ncbi:ParB/Srx family N-terminal domain-containing protein, partial [Roseisolibacter sp. H3M3-2]|uniref:ParB/Srx family N-terminal domain-containing protein n=1 Tax=Roseisolibacter sp. H3M3-2 TaxID=3031323 RepID=UPI0023DA8201